MKKKDFLFIAALILFSTISLWLRDREPTTPEEILQAVLDRADGTIEPASLPLGQAIKQVRGNGERILVSFEDPNCVYCIELDKKLNRLDNVTHYTFLIPILSADSLTKSRRIWCAASPAAAWNDWMLKRTPPSGASDCDTTAIDKNLELWETLNLMGLPRLFRAR